MPHEIVDPAKIFGSNPDNYNKSRIDYPAEFVAGVLQDIFHDSTLAPTKERPRVVDIGAGTGKLGNVFLELGCETVFVEPNAKAVEFLHLAFDTRPGASIIQAKADNIGLPDKSADVIVIGDTAHWIGPDSLPELSRILKPGGQVASFSRFWSLESPLTEKLHELLSVECEDYRASPNQFMRDMSNYRKRLGRHLISVEDSQSRSYGFVQEYSKEELVNYFKSISSTSVALQEDEASFRKNVIKPLWEFADQEGLLTQDKKLKVPYEVNVWHGSVRKRAVEHAAIESRNGHQPLRTGGIAR